MDTRVGLAGIVLVVVVDDDIVVLVAEVAGTVRVVVLVVVVVVLAQSSDRLELHRWTDCGKRIVGWAWPVLWLVVLLLREDCR